MMQKKASRKDEGKCPIKLQNIFNREEKFRKNKGQMLSWCNNKLKQTTLGHQHLKKEFIIFCWTSSSGPYLRFRWQFSLQLPVAYLVHKPRISIAEQEYNLQDGQICHLTFSGWKFQFTNFPSFMMHSDSLTVTKGLCWMSAEKPQDKKVLRRTVDHAVGSFQLVSHRQLDMQTMPLVSVLLCMFKQLL